MAGNPPAAGFTPPTERAAAATPVSIGYEVHHVKSINYLYQAAALAIAALTSGFAPATLEAAGNAPQHLHAGVVRIMKRCIACHSNATRIAAWRG